MERQKTLEFLYMTLPVLVTAFFILVLTLICDRRWLIALIQIPAWAALMWWLYMTKEIYNGAFD